MQHFIKAWKQHFKVDGVAHSKDEETSSRRMSVLPEVSALNRVWIQSPLPPNLCYFHHSTLLPQYVKIVECVQNWVEFMLIQYT